MATFLFVWGNIKSAAFLFLLALATAGLLTQARNSGTRASLASTVQPSVALEDGPTARDTREFAAVELDASNSQPSTSARVLSDVQEALEVAPDALPLDLPHSESFEEAFRKYKETGICDALDLNKYVEPTMLDQIKERLHEPKLSYEDLTDFAESEDPWLALSVMAEKMMDPLSISCFIIGLYIFFIWLFFLVWQTCIGCCRKACYCIQSTKRDLSWDFIVLTMILGSVLAVCSLAMICFGQLGMDSSVDAIGASSCSVLDIVHSVEWGTQSGDASGKTGKDANKYLIPGLMDSDEIHPNSFVGIRGLLWNLNGLEALGSSHSNKNLLELAKRYITDFQSLDVQLEAIRKANQAFEKNTKSLDTVAKGHQMRSVLAEKVNSVGSGFYTPFADFHEQYKHAVEESTNRASLPAIDFTDHLDLKEIELGVTYLQEYGEEASRQAVPVANAASFFLWLETLLIISGIILAAIALSVFFVTKGKANTCLNGFTWNWMLITVSLSLITTGLFFLASSGGNEVCNIGLRVLSQEHADTYEDAEKFEKGLEELAVSIFGDEGARYMGCIRENNFNLFEVSGMQHKVDQALAELRRAQSLLVEPFPSYGSTSLSSVVKEMQEVVNEFGALVVFDQNELKKSSSTSSLLNTFPEILHSGVQLHTSTVELPNGKTEIVYGMEKVLELIFPAGVQGYSQSGSTLTVTAQYPTADDETFKTWLTTQETTKEAELKSRGISDSDAKTQAKEYAQKLKNAVLLTALKLRFLEETVSCNSVTTQGVNTSTCKVRTMLGIPEGRNSGLIHRSAYTLSSAASGFEKAVNTHIMERRTYVNDIFTLLIQFILNIVESSNCTFMRQYMVEAVYVGCSSGVGPTWDYAFLRFFGQIIAIFLAIFIFVIWRIQKDNDYHRRKEEEKDKEEKKKLLADKKRDRDGKETVKGDDGKGDNNETQEAFDETWDRPTHGKGKEQLASDSSSMWA